MKREERRNKNTENAEFTEEGKRTDKNSVFSVPSVFKNPAERCEAALFFFLL